MTHNVFLTVFRRQGDVIARVETANGVLELRAGQRDVVDGVRVDVSREGAAFEVEGMGVGFLEPGESILL